MDSGYELPIRALKTPSDEGAELGSTWNQSAGKPVRFTSNSAAVALQEWLAVTDIPDRAGAHNVKFDDRPSAHRVAAVEAHLNKPGMSYLKTGLIEYWREEVLLAPVPACFDTGGHSVLPTIPSGEQKLLRLECIADPLEKTGLTLSDLERLMRARTPEAIRALNWFCQEWCSRPDILRNPVAFATFKDQHLADINASDWVERLRNRLGLAHLSAIPSAPIPVALVEYEVDEVLAQHGHLGPGKARFVPPSSVDQKPYAYFYPAPTTMAFGCPMSLEPVEDPSHLVAELLHPRINYRAEHLMSVGFVTTSIPKFGLDELRNSHLLAIRLDSSDYAFGEDI